MHQTVYPKRRTRERHRRTEAANSVDAFAPREASDEHRLAHYYAPPLGGVVVVGAAAERFLRLPVPVVLGALWLLGTAMLGSVVLMLYVLGTSLASVVGGA